MSILSKLQALLTAANTKTGESDTTLTDAVQTLVDGYGQGGGYSLADMASGAVPVGVLDITGLTFKEYAFSGCTGITSVVGTGQFAKGYLFMQCTNIETVHVELTQSVSSNQFNGCTKLKTGVIKQDVSIPGATALFNGCTALEKADLEMNQINTNMFYNCSNLATIILRNDENIVTLPNINNLGQTKFKSGGDGGVLYVPSSLKSTYESDTNWSTILGYTNNSIQVIEGSQYENYYADGTPIS